MCSVIVPCYNASDTVEATLSSALALPETTEIIAVDDGSKDGTRELLARIAATDPRIRVISQANAGVAAARNTGIAAATGEFIAFLDSDDIWRSGHLGQNLAALRNDPALGISFSRARFVDARGRQTGLARPKLNGLTPADFLSGNPCTTASTVVVRKAVLDEVGGFNERLRRNEDQEWLFRVSITRWRIEGLDDVLVDYRTSPNGLASDLDALLIDFERVLEEARTRAPEIVARTESIARARTHRYLARRALRLGAGRDTAWRHIKQALAAAPSLVASEPRATISTLVASLLPPNRLLDRALR